MVVKRGLACRRRHLCSEFCEIRSNSQEQNLVAVLVCAAPARCTWTEPRYAHVLLPCRKFQGKTSQPSKVSGPKACTCCSRRGSLKKCLSAATARLARSCRPRL